MGLLDGLFSDDARLGIGLLAAGGYQPTKMSFGQRVAQALQGEDARKKGVLQSEFLKAQLDDAKQKMEFEAQQRPLLLSQLESKNRQSKLISDLVTGSMGAPTAPDQAGGMPSQAPGMQSAPMAQPSNAGGSFDAELRSAQALSYLDPAKGRAQLEVLKLKYPDLGEHQGILFNKRTGQAVTSMPFGTATGSVIQYQPQPGGGFGVSSPAGANDVLRQQARIKAEEEARFKPYETKPTGPNDYPRVRPLLDVMQPQPSAPAPAIAQPPAPAPLLTDPQTQKPLIPGIVPQQQNAPTLQAIPRQVQAARDTDRLTILRQEQARQQQLGRVDPALIAELSQAERQAGIAPRQPMSAAPTVPANAIGPSPKVEADIAANREFQIGDAKARQEQYAILQRNAFSNQSKIAKLERIGALLNDYSGGKLAQSGYELARLGTSLGITIDPKLPNKEAANALSNEVALELRSTGDGAGMPGAMSDADREFLKSMTPQLAQTADGRKQIIESRVSVMKREQLVADMARRYRLKHGSIDEAFYMQLQQWADRNPVFKNANR